MEAGSLHYGFEGEAQYFYHGDHLGSAQMVTDKEGRLYEHLEYTPYGELWVDRAVSAASGKGTPFRFSGKELDAETGLYYYGARYLDPKTSRWLSADPAMADYIPGAPVNDEAKKRNQSLPGMGGVFNVVNLHVYHYAANNPVKYTDPDGKILESIWDAVSLGIGIASLVNNISNGEVTDALVDGLGIVADAAALIVPFVPGGAGAAIKAARVAKVLDDISDAASATTGTIAAGKAISDGEYADAALNAAGVVGVGLGRRANRAFKDAEGFDRAGRNAGTTRGAAANSRYEAQAKTLGRTLRGAETAIDASKLVDDLRVKEPPLPHPDVDAVSR